MTSGPDDRTSTIGPAGVPKNQDTTGSARPNGFLPGDLHPGSRLGTRYTILKILGRGGMGVVYQAWDAELGVPIAIKMILPDREGDEPAREAAEARFKRELLTARQVTHKNVVRIHDLGEIEGQKYITMPYVEGETLASLMKRTGPLPVKRALALARQIADGLCSAHEAGVVHRDLKPANIMVTPDGQALILDFGIARANAGAATQSGVVMGTLEYMAPEQAGGGATDYRTDLYAFGLILYDMLVGRQRLALADTPMSELLDRAKHAPIPPRSLRPDLPDALERIVLTCVQPEAKAGYATMAELSDALTGVLPDGQLNRVREGHVSRRNIWLAAIAAIVVLSLSEVGWQYLPVRDAPAAPVNRPPMSLLIADFENRTDDPEIGHLVEQALAVGVECATFLNVMPARGATGLPVIK